MKKIILVTIFLLFICSGLYSMTKGNIEDIVICTVNNESHYIPTSVCEYYLFVFRGTREDIAYLDHRSGIAFLFNIPDKDKRNKLLSYFVSKGISLNKPSSIDGYPPLHAAIINNDSWLVKYLLENGADPSRKDSNQNLTAKEFTEYLGRKNPAVDRSAIFKLFDNI